MIQPSPCCRRWGEGVVDEEECLPQTRTGNVIFELGGSYGTPSAIQWNVIDHLTEGGAVPRGTWNQKRERQYDHIKEGLIDRGESEGQAEEIAARTVNKERARSGESRAASRTSVKDISSSRRAGLRSHKGSGGRTRQQLYEEARRKNVVGRSTMSKAQLERAVDR